MEVIEKSAGFMLNHVPNFRNVYESTYRTGTITDFEVATTNPFTLTGRCKVIGVSEEDPDRESPYIPIVYNCKRAAYNDEGTRIETNKSINGAAMAFKVGYDVKVLMECVTPAGVITFATGPPRMCKDLFRISMWSWFDTAPGEHQIHFSFGRRGLYAALNVDCRDSYGFTGQFNLEAQRLFGKREFQLGTTMSYWGDWLVLVGPVALIVRIKSVGLPGPVTDYISVSAGLWTPSNEAEWIAHGELKEKSLPEHPLVPEGISRILDTPYPHTYYQSDLTEALRDELLGVMKYPYPRWIWTKMWGQQWAYEVE